MAAAGSHLVVDLPLAADHELAAHGVDDGGAEAARAAHGLGQVEQRVAVEVQRACATSSGGVSVTAAPLARWHVQALGLRASRRLPQVRSTRPAVMPASSRGTSVSTSWMEGPIVAMILLPARVRCEEERHPTLMRGGSGLRRAARMRARDVQIDGCAAGACGLLHAPRCCSRATWMRALLAINGRAQSATRTEGQA